MWYRGRFALMADGGGAHHEVGHENTAHPDLADVCTPGNPRDVTIDDIKALYKTVL